MYDNNNSDKINYKFYCSVGVDSIDWDLAKYFQLIGSSNSKDKILSAANAYWQPLVAEYEGKDTSSIKKSVNHSIYRLQKRIYCLQSLKWSRLPSPGLTNESETTEAIPLDLRYRINPDSIYCGILNYFQSKPTTFTEEEMILWSSSAYWQPIAQRYLGFCEREADWRKAVSESVQALEQHIKYLQINFEVDSTPSLVRETQFLESPTNKVMSLSEKKTQTQNSSPDAHTAPNSTQTEVQADSTPPQDETKAVEKKQQINWIDQIDDPLLKPRESDKLFAQMFENIGKK